MHHPWPENDGGPFGQPGGEAYAALAAERRRLADLLSGAVLPDQLAHEITERFADISRLVDGHQAPEQDRVDGWRPDLPGRGHPLLPPYVVDEHTANGLRGRVSFGRYHLGGGGAAHGGTPPLLFDDLLGRVVNQGMATVARTAFLRTDYRRIVPLDVDLRFEATLDGVEGRKRWASGRLTGPDGAVLCEATALFVELRPGQP